MHPTKDDNMYFQYSSAMYTTPDVPSTWDPINTVSTLKNVTGRLQGYGPLLLKYL